MRKRFFLVLFFLVAACTTVRQVTLTDDELKSNLKRHISILSSDEYQGREAGTKGEELAMNYTINQFKEVGLKPSGEKKFIQEFSFTEGATIGNGTQLYINTKSFKLNDPAINGTGDFYSLQYSGNGVVLGYIAKVGY